MLKLTLQGFPSFAEVNHYVKSLINLFLFGCWKHCKACRADQTVNNSKWLKDLIFYAPFFSNSYFYFSSWVMKCYSLYISSFNAQTSVFYIWKSLIWKLTQVLMLADRFSPEIELNITINKVLRCISHGKCIYFFFLFFDCNESYSSQWWKKFCFYFILWKVFFFPFETTLKLILNILFKAAKWRNG